MSSIDPTSSLSLARRSSEKSSQRLRPGRQLPTQNGESYWSDDIPNTGIVPDKLLLEKSNCLHSTSRQPLALQVVMNYEQTDRLPVPVVSENEACSIRMTRMTRTFITAISATCRKIMNLNYVHQRGSKYRRNRASQQVCAQIK